MYPYGLEPFTAVKSLVRLSSWSVSFWVPRLLYEYTLQAPSKKKKKKERKKEPKKRKNKEDKLGGDFLSFPAPKHVLQGFGS